MVLVRLHVGDGQSTFSGYDECSTSPSRFSLAVAPESETTHRFALFSFDLLRDLFAVILNRFDVSLLMRIVLRSTRWLVCVSVLPGRSVSLQLRWFSEHDRSDVRHSLRQRFLNFSNALLDASRSNSEQKSLQTTEKINLADARHHLSLPDRLSTHDHRDDATGLSPPEYLHRGSRHLQHFPHDLFPLVLSRSRLVELPLDLCRTKNSQI